MSSFLLVVLHSFWGNWNCALSFWHHPAAAGGCSLRHGACPDGAQQRPWAQSNSSSSSYLKRSDTRKPGLPLPGQRLLSHFVSKGLFSTNPEVSGHPITFHIALLEILQQPFHSTHSSVLCRGFSSVAVKALLLLKLRKAVYKLRFTPCTGVKRDEEGLEMQGVPCSPDVNPWICKVRFGKDTGGKRNSVSKHQEHQLCHLKGSTALFKIGEMFKECRKKYWK